jgi:hypothetical protein
MKLIIILVLLQTTFSITETKVYMCGITGAKKYHYSENCRGLNACKHEIVKATLSEAQGYGLKLCGWED